MTTCFSFDCHLYIPTTWFSSSCIYFIVNIQDFLVCSEMRQKNRRDWIVCEKEKNAQKEVDWIIFFILTSHNLVTTFNQKWRDCTKSYLPFLLDILRTFPPALCCLCSQPGQACADGKHHHSSSKRPPGVQRQRLEMRPGQLSNQRRLRHACS